MREITEIKDLPRGNIHNVEFKIILNGENDYRLEEYQGGIFWTDKGYKSFSSAKRQQIILRKFYHDFPDAYLFSPKI